MFKMHDQKLIVFVFYVRFCGLYCPPFWDSMAIYKAHDSRHMFSRHDKNYLYLTFYGCFYELLFIVGVQGRYTMPTKVCTFFGDM
jgi:hypothetical protein